ncbi:hypothetical protein VNO77_05955 [Canavalia gladiata]|uniref:Uncharacterized protein n=1 Tax=Canavalia gladiata TaxID=3824 RepID=A0AAN9R948_CANGL
MMTKLGDWSELNSQNYPVAVALYIDDKRGGYKACGLRIIVIQWLLLASGSWWLEDHHVSLFLMFHVWAAIVLCFMFVP